MNLSTLTTRNLLTILDVSRRLAEQRMIQWLVEYAATTMFDLIPAERCLFVFFDDDDGLRVQLARTREGATIPGAADQVSRSILRQVQATLTPMLVEDALARGGTCTGEHGIGFGKLGYLEREHGDLIPLYRGIKQVFDPNGIMNPGKVISA